MPSNRPSDQLVDAKAILEAISELKRRGIDSIMQELEATERDLASHIMEEFSLIHQTLTKTGATSRQIRGVIIQVETLVLVSILSLRKAQRRLWKEDSDDSAPVNLPPLPPDSPV